MAKAQRKKIPKTRVSRANAAQVLLSLQASGFVVTFLVLIVAGVVILSPTLRVLAEQQQEIAALEAALAESEQQVVALEEQRERWKDPAFVETQARERLLFVYPGDITYLVIDDGEPVEEEELKSPPESWRPAQIGANLCSPPIWWRPPRPVTTTRSLLTPSGTPLHEHCGETQCRAISNGSVSSWVDLPGTLWGFLRGVCGNPIVVMTNPRLEDGTPFPTLYYFDATRGDPGGIATRSRRQDGRVPREARTG